MNVVIKFKIILFLVKQVYIFIVNFALKVYVVLYFYKNNKHLKINLCIYKITLPCSIFLKKKFLKNLMKIVEIIIPYNILV